MCLPVARPSLQLNRAGSILTRMVERRWHALASGRRTADVLNTELGNGLVGDGLTEWHAIQMSD
jgi:hypothetical protein